MKRLLLLFAISLMAMTSAFAETATFDFSTAEAQAAYTINKTSGTVCTLSAQQGVVKLDAKDDGDDDINKGLIFFYDGQYHLRIYAENSLFKISVPTGYKITKITFEITGERGFQHGESNNTNNYTGPELTLSEDKSTETYTAPSGETVTEVAYETTSAHYCPRIKKVIVEYENVPDFTWNFSDATLTGDVLTDGNGILVKNCSEVLSISEEMWLSSNSHLNIELENGKKMVRIVVTSHKFDSYDPIQWIVDQTVDATWTNLGSYVGEWTGESESVACGNSNEYLIDKIEVWAAEDVESALAALMGTTKYATGDRTSIYVNADGRIEIMWNGDPSKIEKIGETNTVSAESDGNYKIGDDYCFIFYVAEGEVIKVKEFFDGELFNVYLPVVEEETPTDITDVEIVKPSLSKTIKVLKNGKIVIIKNGVTYDLSGSVTE